VSLSGGTRLRAASYSGSDSSGLGGGSIGTRTTRSSFASNADSNDGKTGKSNDSQVSVSVSDIATNSTSQSHEAEVECINPNAFPALSSSSGAQRVVSTTRIRSRALSCPPTPVHVNWVETYSGLFTSAESPD